MMGKQKRWYDQNNAVSSSIETMEGFPEEIQAIVADGIILLAEREGQAKELMNNLRSLGPEKVLAIFKSKNKRREYDENNTVHRAMNYLYLLSESNRLFIANQVQEIVNTMRDYLALCESGRRAPSAQDARKLTETYLASGVEDTRRLLDEIRDRFQQNLTEALRHNEEHLRQDRSGLRIQDR